MPRSSPGRNEKQKERQAEHVGGALLPAARSGTQAPVVTESPSLTWQNLGLCMRSSSTNTCLFSRAPVRLTEADNTLSI